MTSYNEWRRYRSMARPTTNIMIQTRIRFNNDVTCTACRHHHRDRDCFHKYINRNRKHVFEIN